jgi:hypothetical protein
MVSAGFDVDSFAGSVDVEDGDGDALQAESSAPRSAGRSTW